MSNEINIPSTICFRVTRKCNIKCSFCQAPPTGEFDMSLDEIKRCIDRLSRLLDFCVENKIEKISFISMVERGNGKSQINSQGISLNDVSVIVQELREKYKTLNLRLLDFSKDYYVLESNGKLYIEVDEEKQDTYLCDLLHSDSKLVCCI